MSTLEIFFLALLQGFTEFLPISSSAHLIFPSQLLGWSKQGLAFDVAVHVGTLLAVILYYRKDVLLLSSGWIETIRTQNYSGHGLLSWYVIFATIPALIFGYLGSEIIENNLRTLGVIAFTTLFFGVLLGYADIKARENLSLEGLSAKHVLWIGLAQMLALIPGTSRSGITMTAGLLIGLRKECAARFSFLLSIPIISMAGGYITLKLIKSISDIETSISELLIGGGISFIAAFLSIHFFIKLIGRLGMMPFVLYRIILGMFLLYFIL